MAFWNRDKNKKAVLPELEWYYDGERKDKSRTAWLLALVTILGAVLLLLGLFFGGRYVYRQINKDDKKPAATQNEGEGEEKPAQTPEDEPEDSDVIPIPNNEGRQETPAPAPAPTPAPKPTPKPAPQTPAPATPQPLTNTGPESVIPVFVVTVVAGTVLYSYKLRRSNAIR